MRTRWSGVTTEFLGRSQATATMTAEDGMNDPLEYSDDKYQAFFFTVSSTSTYRLPHYLPPISIGTKVVATVALVE